MMPGEIRKKWDELRARRDEYQTRWEDFTKTKPFWIGFTVVFFVIFFGGIIWTAVRPEEGWWSNGSAADTHHVHAHAPHEASAHEQAERPHEPPPRPMHMR